MRSLALLCLLAALGVAGALLVGCGDDGGGIPAGDAEAIKSDLDGVAAGVADERCERAAASALRAEQKVLRLPASVDAETRRGLARKVLELGNLAADECRERETTETDTTETETQPTETVPTETQPTETQPTDTQPTQTQPTTPPPTTPPATTPPNPPPGGGTPGSQGLRERGGKKGKGK